MKKVYQFYGDSGHGWLKVKVEELIRLKIHLAISGYSYVKGEYAYLEEDCDFGKFFNAKCKVDNVNIVLREHHSNQSKIRWYDSYNIYSIIQKPTTFEAIRRSALLWWRTIDGYSRREAIKNTAQYKGLELEDRTVISSIAIHRIFKNQFSI